MSDREAVKLALFLAIEWERSLIGSLSEDDPEADKCRYNIRAFERVLDRRYGGARLPQPDGGRRLTFADMLALPPRQFDPTKALKP